MPSKAIEYSEISVSFAENTRSLKLLWCAGTKDMTDLQSLSQRSHIGRTINILTLIHRKNWHGSETYTDETLISAFVKCTVNSESNELIRAIPDRCIVFLPDWAFANRSNQQRKNPELWFQRVQIQMPTKNPLREAMTDFMTNGIAQRP